MSLTAPSPSPSSRFEILLREARNGSKEARWLLFQLYRNMMLAVANQKIDRDVMPKEGASDIVQNTIMEAEKDFDGFHGQTEGELKAWLNRVLENNIENLIRKYRTIQRNPRFEQPIGGKSNQPGHAGDIPDPGPSPSTQIVGQEIAEALEHAIQGLPPHYRCVIDLRYRKGLPYGEIARRMGRTEVATRRLWSRALHELSRRMRHHI